MKKLIYILFIQFVCLQAIYSQSGWFQLTTGTSAGINSIYFIDVNTGYLAADSGRIFKTTNGGMSWDIRIVNPLRYLTSIFFTDLNTGYVCGDSGYVLKTTNAGLNWNQLSLNSQTYLLNIFFSNANTGYISDYSGTVFRTTNGGVNWILITGTSYPIHSVHFIGSTGYLSGGTYDVQGNIHKTTNSGLNWSSQYITAEPINSIQFIDNNTGYAAGGDPEFGSILLKTTNGGTNWTQLLNPTFGWLNSISFVNSDTGYAAGLPGIIKTTNGGVNWITQYINPSILTSIYMLNSTTGYATGFNGSILKTTTGGDSITYYSISGQIRYQDNNLPVNSGYVKALHYDSTSYTITTIDSVQIQSNGNYLFSRIPPNISFDIMAFENDEDNLNFVPTYYPSTINWQNATEITLSNSGLSNIDVLVYRINNTGGPFHIAGHIYKQTQAVRPEVDGAIIYAKIGDEFKAYSLTKSSGAYRIDSLPSGTFTLFAQRMGYNGQLKNVEITNFSKDSIDFVFDNYLIGINNEGLIIPESYWLGNSFPNPFNPSVTIKFGLPKTSLTRIIIYDMLGREILRLVNEELKSGNYSINWNASGFASGIYFYRIEAGDFVETKKMILLK